MKNIIGLKDLRENMETYAAQVEGGKTFVVMKRSRPLFRIVPIDAEEEGWETVVDFTKIRKGGVSFDEVLARL